MPAQTGHATVPFEPPLHAPRSAQMYEHAQQVLALGVSSSLRRNIAGFPLYFDRAAGPYFYDVEGNKLLDYTLGFGPLILGSGHPAITEAVAGQLARGYTFGASHPLEYEVAELITQVVPGVEQVVLSNTGSEAVQVALRLARAATGRGKVVVFDGHYHGWLNNVRIRRHPTPSYLGEPVAVFADQPPGEYDAMIVARWNDEAELRQIFDTYGPQIAAVLCEPIPTSGGCLPQAGFLELVVALCAEHEAFSVFDEVVTGFRLALGGARAYFGIEPTLSVYGKAIGGGLALSAVGGRRSAFAVLWDGVTSHAGTYNGNPISLAAASATIRELTRPGVYDAIHAHGNHVRAHIEAAANAASWPAVTSGTGAFFSVLPGLDTAPSNEEEVRRADFARYDWFKAEMLRRGVYLGPEGRWMVSAAHTDTELAIVTAAISDAIGVVSDPTRQAPPALPSRRL